MKSTFGQARTQLATLEKETARLQQELRDGFAAADAAVRPLSSLCCVLFSATALLCREAVFHHDAV